MFKVLAHGEIVYLRVVFFLVVGHIMARGDIRLDHVDLIKRRQDQQLQVKLLEEFHDSRRALLEAFIERIKQEAEKPLLPIIHDPHLTAIEKLQGFFETLDRLRIAHQADVVKLMRVWYTDANAIVRLKVDEAVLQQRAPLLTEIVRQGIREGIFTTANPDYAAEDLLARLQSIGNTHARLLLSVKQERDDLRCIARVVANHAAYID